MGSEAAKLHEIKEQHFIQTLGLGWEDAHHPWSKNGMTYSAQHLLDHLCKVVISLAAKKTIPDDALAKLLAAPDVHTLVTLSPIGEELKIKGLSEIAQFKEKGREERDRREEEGFGDRWADRQRVVRPDIDKHFIGFRIEMLFHYIHGQEYIWCHGEVIAIKNAKKENS